ncbi:MAG: putative inner rane protein [Rubritepida sp.]|nr:putative inner rane protein [Rubritepida sp.]
MSLELLILPLGFFVAAFCSGLAGFAFNLIAAGILFHFVAPQVLAPVLVMGSLVTQMVSLPHIWRAIRWRALIPQMLAGVIGTPLGVLILGVADAKQVAVAVGILLVGYAGYALARIALRVAPARFVAPAAADNAIGFAAGILGGIGGFSGALPAIWTDAQGLPKDQARARIQPFVSVMQIVAGTSLALGGFFTRESGLMFLSALPALLLGTFLGLRAFRIIPAQGFRLVLLGLLLISGLSLLA